MLSRRTALASVVLFAPLLFAPSLLAPLPALAQAAPQEPKAIVDWIYLETQKSGKNPDYNFALMSKKQRARFSKAFLSAWDGAEKRAAKKEEPLIEADPVTETQDPQVASFTTKVDSQTEKSAQVTATFRYSPKDAPKSIVYKFVKEGAAWKIDDVGGMRAMFRAYK